MIQAGTINFTLNLKTFDRFTVDIVNNKEAYIMTSWHEVIKKMVLKPEY